MKIWERRWSMPMILLSSGVILPLVLVTLLVGAFILVASHSCDPDAHIFIRNNYPFPVVVHHLANGSGNMPDQILDTLPAGKRSEVAINMRLDGDVDNIQLEDKQGHVLQRLNQKNSNVVCKQTTPEYVWEITVGP